MLSYWLEYYWVTSDKLLNLSFYKVWINYVPPTSPIAGQIKKKPQNNVNFYYLLLDKYFLRKITRARNVSVRLTDKIMGKV